MKKSILFIGFIFCTLFVGHAQVLDSLSKEGNTFYRNGHEISKAGVLALLEGNQFSAPECHNYFSRHTAANLYLTGAIVCFGTAVTFLVLEEISVSNRNNDINNFNASAYNNDNNAATNYALGAIGFDILTIGCTAGTIVSLIRANRDLNNAIDLYNSNGRKTGYNPVQLNLMVSSNGLGIRMSF